MISRAVQLRPDLSCLWKLLGDACTAVSTVSPNRAKVIVPALLAGLDANTESQMLNQAQTLKVGERYGHYHIIIRLIMHKNSQLLYICAFFLHCLSYLPLLAKQKLKLICFATGAMLML